MKNHQTQDYAKTLYKLTGLSIIRNSEKQRYGGQTGIRTLETVTRLHTFQACAFDHSATCPTNRTGWKTRGV